MSTWYEATTYGVITPKEVERVTESSVFSGGRRTSALHITPASTGVISASISCSIL